MFLQFFPIPVLRRRHKTQWPPFLWCCYSCIVTDSGISLVEQYTPVDKWILNNGRIDPKKTPLGWNITLLSIYSFINRYVLLTKCYICYPSLWAVLNVTPFHLPSVAVARVTTKRITITELSLILGCLVTLQQVSQLALPFTCSLYSTASYTDKCQPHWVYYKYWYNVWWFCLGTIVYIYVFCHF